jgi:hypothetical protein
MTSTGTIQMDWPNLMPTNWASMPKNFGWRLVRRVVDNDPIVFTS